MRVMSLVVALLHRENRRRKKKRRIDERVWWGGANGRGIYAVCPLGCASSLFLLEL
jgi:hypothetical protein